MNSTIVTTTATRISERPGFIRVGLQQTGWVVLVLSVLAAAGFAAFLFEFEALVFGLLGMLGIAALSLLSGPIPLLLTFFDISDTQFYWLWAVFAVLYWIVLDVLAGFVRWKDSFSDLASEQDPTSRRSRNLTRQYLEIALLALAKLGYSQRPIAGPNHSNVRNMRAVKNAIVNNLRQLDAAKQQLALEKGLSPDHVPNETEPSPYVPHFHRIGPERYVLNAIRDEPYAVLDSDWRIRRQGWREGITYLKGDYRLP